MATLYVMLLAFLMLTLLSSTAALRTPSPATRLQSLSGLTDRSDTYGGEGGSPFDDSEAAGGAFGQIKTIEMGCGQFVDSITVTYETGRSYHHGGNGGELRRLDLDYGEHVTSATVVTEWPNPQRVNQLVFTTSRDRVLSCGVSPRYWARTVSEWEGDPFAPLAYVFGACSRIVDRIGFASGWVPRAIDRERRVQRLLPQYASRDPATGALKGWYFDDWNARHEQRARIDAIDVKVGSIGVGYRKSYTAVQGFTVHYNDTRRTGRRVPTYKHGQGGRGGEGGAAFQLGEDEWVEQVCVRATSCEHAEGIHANDTTGADTLQEQGELRSRECRPYILALQFVLNTGRSSPEYGAYEPSARWACMTGAEGEAVIGFYGLAAEGVSMLGVYSGPLMLREYVVSELHFDPSRSTLRTHKQVAVKDVRIANHEAAGRHITQHQQFEVPTQAVTTVSEARRLHVAVVFEETDVARIVKAGAQLAVRYEGGQVVTTYEVNLTSVTEECSFDVLAPAHSRLVGWCEVEMGKYEVPWVGVARKVYVEGREPDTVHIHGLLSGETVLKVHSDYRDVTYATVKVAAIVMACFLLVCVVVVAVVVRVAPRK